MYVATDTRSSLHVSLRAPRMYTSTSLFESYIIAGWTSLHPFSSIVHSHQQAYRAYPRSLLLLPHQIQVDGVQWTVHFQWDLTSFLHSDTLDVYVFNFVFFSALTEGSDYP